MRASRLAIGASACLLVFGSALGDDAKANAESLALEGKRAAEVAQLRLEAVAWRQNLRPGLESHCGMVLETRVPLVKVQTLVGEKWFRPDQLYPAGQRSCIFWEGVFQD